MGRRKKNRPKKLGSKLREIRLRLDIGQKEMARKLQRVEESVHPGIISKFENSKLEPSLIVLLEYSRIAGMSMEALVDDKLKLQK